MNSDQSDTQPKWTPAQLIEALNQRRDACTNASMALRDIQFGLDTDKRREAMEHANALVNKVKPD